MIAVDTNILVYAHRQDTPWHDIAARCLRALAEGNASWAIPWPCVHEFFSTVTRPRVFSPPSTTTQALRQLDAWLASPTLTLLHESATYWNELRPLLEAGRICGPMVHDARIAALCMHHGVHTLWTADRDFSRFADLHTSNPLLSPTRKAD
ncbi:MAG: type II toxin-antitoxin system VapC family toxin [Polyangiales bacterium]